MSAHAQATLPSSATKPAASRVRAIDALRGVAIVAMVAYHFAFDLAYFHVTSWNFYRDPFWITARTLILSSFLLLAGIGLALAERSESGRRRFWQHVLRIGACAVAVSAATYVVFPRSFIWFGVLHAIALSLVLIRPLASRPLTALISGVVIVIAGVTWSSGTFDHRWLAWIGFTTMKPITEDYVPLFPWTGVMLVGIAVGHLLTRNRFRAVAPMERLPSVVSWLGRHSLAIYMLHQPLMLGVIWLFVR